MTNEKVDIASSGRQQALSAAQRYMGEFAWPTVLFTFAVAAIYSLNLWLLIEQAIPLWLGCTIFAALSYMAYTPLHEAVHNNINGKNESLKWLNNLCGYIAAQITGLPFTSHQPEHKAHHRFTNKPDEDPDYVVRTMGDGLWVMLVTQQTFFWTQVTYFPRVCWRGASKTERAVYVLEMVVILGWRIAVISLLPPLDALLIFVVAFGVGALFLSYWFAYRPHHPYTETARYQNTSSLLMPRWMMPFEWLWLGQNLHSMHHLFPRVPFYQYHALYRDIEPVLRSEGAPIIGIYDRLPK